MHKRTILFDLDGTLTDPGLGITNSILYALGEMGMEQPPREALYRFIGPPLVDEFQKVYGASRETAYTMVKHFQVYFADRGIYENSLYDGVPAMLERLQAAECALVLATSKPEVFAKRVLEHFDLMKYFDAVAGSNIDETRTAKAEVIAYALEKTGAAQETAVMVGDRKHDVTGAKANGLRSLGVLYGYGSRRELTEAGADLLAETVPDVAEVLLQHP